MNSLFTDRAFWILGIAIGGAATFLATQWDTPRGPSPHPRLPLPLELTALDADDGRPLIGGHVIAREFTFVSGAAAFGHSSGDYPACYRGAIGRTDASGKAVVTQPATTAADAQKFDGAAHMSWMIYVPHYCVPGDSVFGMGPLIVFPDGWGEGAHIVVPGESPTYRPLRVELARSSDHGEQRIRYLSDVIDSLSCRYDHWPNELAEQKARMEDALLTEVQSEIKTEFDQYLYDQLRKRIDPFRLDVADPASPMKWGQERPDARSVGVGPAPARHVLTCGSRPISECNVNWRDRDGRTPLMKAMLFFGMPKRVEYVTALINAGADPNLEQAPGHGTALDGLLHKWDLANRMDAGESARLFEDLQVLELVARDGRATMLPKIRAQLETSEDQWQPTVPEVREFYRRARELTARLPLRQAFRPSCPPKVPPEIQFYLVRQNRR